MNKTFDEKLELLDKTYSFSNSVLGKPSWSNLREAAIYVTDTLDLCVASAEALFGNKATPEVILAIYDRVLSRLKELPHVRDELQG